MKLNKFFLIVLFSIIILLSYNVSACKVSAEYTYYDDFFENTLTQTTYLNLSNTSTNECTSTICIFDIYFNKELYGLELNAENCNDNIVIVNSNNENGLRFKSYKEYNEVNFITNGINKVVFNNNSFIELSVNTFVFNNSDYSVVREFAQTGVFPSGVTSDIWFLDTYFNIDVNLEFGGFLDNEGNYLEDTFTNSYIKMVDDFPKRNFCTTEEKNDIKGLSDESYNLYLDITSLKVMEGSNLDLNMIAKDTEGDKLLQREGNSGPADIAFSCEDGTGDTRFSRLKTSDDYLFDTYSNITSNGGDVNLDIKDMLNYGSLNIYLKAGDGARGMSFNTSAVGCNEDEWGRSNLQIWSKCDLGFDGGNGGLGGFSYLSSNTFENYGVLNVDLFAGDGGAGGNGRKQYATRNKHRKDNLFGEGGNGGNGGVSDISINNIFNAADAYFYLDLYSGNGGRGGNTGEDKAKDWSHLNFKKAGDGGLSGDVGLPSNGYFNELSTSLQEYGLYFNLISNRGIFEINTYPGKAGDGGDKIQDKEEGFNGYNDDDEAGNGGDGGNTIDLFINYLENTSEQFNLNLNYGLAGDNGLFKENLIPDENYPGHTGDVYINNIKSNSYVPKKIFLNYDNYYIENNLDSRNIYMSGCFVKLPGELDYNFTSMDVNFSNYNELSSIFNNNFNNFDGSEIFCPPATEYLIDNSSSNFRTSKKFKIYSQDIGTISNLKVYYADIDGESNYNLFNPRLENNHSVYTYDKVFTYSVPKEESLYGLYEYDLNYNEFRYNFDWWNPNRLLVNGEFPFAYNQQYFIEFDFLKQGVPSPINVRMPFTPVFSTW